METIKMEQKEFFKKLNYAGLSEAEKFTGKSYKEDETTEMLGLLLHVRGNEDKKEMLKNNNDTYFHMPTQGYISIIEDFGFKKIFEEDIPGTWDKYYCFWKDGLLLAFDTYWDHQSINGGDLYFELQGDSSNKTWYSYFGIVGFSGKFIHDIIVGSIDCREGLITQIKYLSEHFKILNDWPEPHRLWLLNYKDKADNSKEINRIKLNSFPENIKQSINYQD
jgi:hypothetical protein